MNAQNELNNLRSELRSIIIELDSISNGLASGFSGISTNVYAAKIQRVANEYRGYLNTLYAAYIKTNNAFPGSNGGGFR